MSNQIYFDAMKAKGVADAADLQERSSSLWMGQPYMPKRIRFPTLRRL